LDQPFTFHFVKVAMSARVLQKCYYEVLSVERTASADEIRSAYRKLALKWHPDRNPDSVEEATAVFQELQSAYAVLSDPHERTWYDDHRESILRGAGEGDDDEGQTVNLWPFFQSSCFKGFSDRPGAFYTVYRDLFSEIAAQEAAGGDTAFIAPQFGDSRTGWPSVAEFYRFWSNFVTTRTFAWKDEYRARPDTPRAERRIMDKLNAKSRETGRREYNSQIRSLTTYMRKLDPRVTAHDTEVAREVAEKAQRQAQARAAREAEQRDADRDKVAAAAVLAAEHAARVDRALAEGWSDGAAADSTSEGDDEECAVCWLQSRVCAEVVCGGSGLFCSACRKSFKSENQMLSHQRSKKHIARVSGTFVMAFMVV
jgi:DnaJ family protein A protein 5